VCHLNVRTFEIKVGMLVLTHSKDLFVRIEALKTKRESIIASKIWTQLPGLYLQTATFRVREIAAVASILFQ